MSVSVSPPDVVTAVASAVSAAVALPLGGFAAVQLRDARTIRQEETRPYVFVDFEVQQHMVYLHIENIGRTPARNLRFRSEPPLMSSIDRGDRHGPSRFLDRTWPFFPPRKVVTSMFDTAIAMLDDDNTHPTRYEVTVSYDDSKGRHYDDPVVLDIESWRGRHFTAEKDLGDVAKAAERIAEALASASRRRSGFVVYTKLLDEVTAEEEAEWAERSKSNRSDRPQVAPAQAENDQGDRQS